jgi:hypothetical protein
MRTVCITLCLLLLATSLVSAADKKEDDEDKSELASQLEKLGIGADTAATVQQSLGGGHSVGGAQNDIPMPDPPAGMSTTYDDDLDDDDDSSDYLRMKDQKEIYEKGGGVQRLTTENFDEEIFNGKQEFTMIVFYSRWCRECQLNGASMRAVGARYRDDPKIKIYAVNQEGNYDLSARFDTDPGESVFFFAKKNPQVDQDIKIYEGEVSFASMMQFIESRGTDMVKAPEHIRELYQPDENNYHAVYQGLNWTNFNDTVYDKTKNVMIQFYAGWSEFCQNDANNYTVLAAQLRLSNPKDTLIAAVDTDKHSRLADRFDVQSLPVYWFAAKNATEDGHLIKYTGDHNGAIVIEEGIPFVTSGGTKPPPGMLDEKFPQHPKPWEQTEREMKAREKADKEKLAKERKEQEKAAAERKEKIAKKKKALQEKKDKEAKAAGGAKHDASEL